MPMREVAVVATVSTDISRIVLCYVGPSFGCPDVHAALSTRCTLDITRCRAAILELDVVFLSCRLRPNTSCLPELPDLREAAPDGFRIVMCSVSRPLSSHPLAVQNSPNCAPRWSPFQSRPTISAGGSPVSVGRVSCLITSSCFDGLPPSIWTRRPRQSLGSETRERAGRRIHGSTRRRGHQGSRESRHGIWGQ